MTTVAVISDTHLPRGDARAAGALRGAAARRRPDPACGRLGDGRGPRGAARPRAARRTRSTATSTSPRSRRRCPPSRAVDVERCAHRDGPRRGAPRPVGWRACGAGSATATPSSSATRTSRCTSTTSTRLPDLQPRKPDRPAAPAPPHDGPGPRARRARSASSSWRSTETALQAASHAADDAGVDDRGGPPRDGFALTFRAGTLKTGVWPTLAGLPELPHLLRGDGGPAAPPRCSPCSSRRRSARRSLISRLPMERILRGALVRAVLPGLERGVIAIVAVRDGARRRLGQPARRAVLPPARLRGAVLPAGLDARRRGARPRRVRRASPRPPAAARASSRSCSPRRSSTPPGSAPGRAATTTTHRRELDRASRDRPAHRLPEPPRLRGALRRRAVARAPRRATEVALVLARPRPLQGRQRPAGPRRRRPAAVLGRRRAARGPARGGHGRPPRRRRVRRCCSVRDRAGAIGVERVGAALAERAPASVGVAVFPGDGVDQDEPAPASPTCELYARKHGRRQPRGRGAPRAELGRRARRRGGRADGRAARALPRRRASYAAAIAARAAAGPPRLDRAAPRRDAPRRRQGARAGGDPAQAGPADRRRSGRRSRQHPVVGAEIVARVEGLAEIGPWIRHSHERLDGAGYPDGLRARTSRPPRASCSSPTPSTR